MCGQGDHPPYGTEFFGVDLATSTDTTVEMIGLPRREYDALRLRAELAASEPDWRPIAERLWDLLDHIDTNDDMAKGDDALFRKWARAHVAERFQIAKSDGHALFFVGVDEIPDLRPAPVSPGVREEEHA